MELRPRVFRLRIQTFAVVSWYSNSDRRKAMRYFYSVYADSARIAIKSILEHKLRAFLTLIGIIIGVAAVVVVGASISGLKTYVVDRVSKVLGSNHFMITRLAFMGRMPDDEFERKNRLNKPVVW